MDRFSNPTNAIPTAKITAKTVATIFLEPWVSNFGILTKFLTDRGPQITSEFFAGICTKFRVNAITTTEYHFQANGQVDRLNLPIFSRLRDNVAEHRKNWDVFALLLYQCVRFASLSGNKASTIYCCSHSETIDTRQYMPNNNVRNKQS